MICRIHQFFHSLIFACFHESGDMFTIDDKDVLKFITSL